MNNIQENQVTMMLTVKDFSANQTTITNTIPNFGNYITSLTGHLAAIQTARDIQQADKTGVTATKNDLRNALEVLALELSARLVAYARVSKNKTLENETAFTKSDLENSPDTIFKDKAQLLYNRGQSNIAALTPYFVTATTQTAYLTALNTYAASITKPALAYDDKQNASATIENTITLAMDDLDNMDVVVRIVANTQSAFYAGWLKAREIPKSGKGALALMIQVSDNFGIPIAKVAVTIGTVPPDTKKITRKTSDKGGNQVKNLVPGTYTATFTKAGYATQKTSFTVTSGETTKLKVVMVMG